MSRWNYCVLAGVALGLVSLFTLAGVAGDEAGLWQTKFEDAKTKAKADNKLLLVDFTGSDWCGWCIKLKKEVFSSFSLLYTWEGTDPSLKPVILTAHMDVVPAGETASWSVSPFSGKNDGTFIWGRGTLDDKSSLISIMEAVEKLHHILF